MTLKGLTLQGGALPPLPPGLLSGGAGLLNRGALTLTDSTLTANGTRFGGSGSDSGGGLFNSGTVTMTKSTIIANNAGQAGGIFQIPPD